MNIDFLKALHQKWMDDDLMKDTDNLDFTTIPYWGEDEHLENNWPASLLKSIIFTHYPAPPYSNR